MCVGAQRRNVYGGPEVVQCLELVSNQKEARGASAWRVRAQTGVRFREKPDPAWPCGHYK